jgi:hypothetical protein
MECLASDFQDPLDISILMKNLISLFLSGFSRLVSNAEIQATVPGNQSAVAMNVLYPVD